MLSTLRLCGTKSVISNKAITIISCPKGAAEVILRRQFVSLIGSKSQNAKNSVVKMRRLFSEEVAPSRLKSRVGRCKGGEGRSQGRCGRQSRRERER